MKCHSHITIILDSRSWTSHPQQYHRTILHSFLLQQLSTAATEPGRKNTIQLLHDHLKRCFSKRTHTGRWRLWEWEQELKYPHILSEEHHGYTTFPQVIICLFDPATPLTTAEQHPEHLPQIFRSHSSVHCHLVFTSYDEESPVWTSDPCLWYPNTPQISPLHGRAEPPSPVQHHMNYHYTSIPSTDDSFQDPTAEEDFSTAPLDDTIWLEDPIPDRHLWIHEQSQPHFQCSYPCPYCLDLRHSSPEGAPVPYFKMKDLSDIWDLQDVMTTTSDEGIPDLEDIFGLWIWTMVCINIYTPWTLSKWSNAGLYKMQCT